MHRRCVFRKELAEKERVEALNRKKMDRKLSSIARFSVHDAYSSTIPCERFKAPPYMQHGVRNAGQEAATARVEGRSSKKGQMCWFDISLKPIAYKSTACPPTLLATGLPGWPRIAALRCTELPFCVDFSVSKNGDSLPTA